ncbi:uncharacterized protein MONOS_12465 [Monocercomonoides exilis]|uniref:uncharacterized protein n=1 Tax=Monocercomonoides exilis TaxID=2049356 RepID=UPI00355A308D|nr:hypothetical protein MONOS_12465 [Monocercomonoides exilis]|eukprot:MONOS_12465.1-p1 / transcript=MONOS_12465.1 / gene=MONOS_12465 / organism=Monocercomonoides_exilis_PA203 / gene_product=unspecified product / transcript_product=unspecified product / location=Mono_scaffold00692:31510-31860(+) / protein_length=117 / sequence_SO=supercontig / SO=protein_coding / is_pseudo=false
MRSERWRRRQGLESGQNKGDYLGGEEGKGDDSWLRDDEGEVREGEGGMGREEEVELVAVVEGRWVDDASGGADGGSGVVLGSEEWTATERDEVEMGHTQGGVDEGEACVSTTDVIS